MWIVLRDDRTGQERRIGPSNALWWMDDKEAHDQELLPAHVHVIISENPPAKTVVDALRAASEAFGRRGTNR